MKKTGKNISDIANNDKGLAFTPAPNPFPSSSHSTAIFGLLLFLPVFFQVVQLLIHALEIGIQCQKCLGMRIRYFKDESDFKTTQFLTDEKTPQCPSLKK